MGNKLTDIQLGISEGELFWKRHALERMFERGITRKMVKQAILNGDIIEDYPDDYPFPSFLIGTLTPEPLHVVVSFDLNYRTVNIITVYFPDLVHFNEDYITRR